MTPKERLAFLANALEANAADPGGMRFDLSSWMKIYYDPLQGPLKPLFDENHQLTAKRDCATVGCAVGLACLLPEFQSEGLTIVLHERLGVVPCWDGYVSFAAVRAFFDIEHSLAEYFFHPQYSRQITGAAAERQVASRIRAHLVETS